MSRKQSLPHRIRYELSKMIRYGESKHQSKIEENTIAPKGIFSFSTYKDYLKHCVAFGKWCQKEYGVRNPKTAKKYVDEYLQKCLDKGLSPSTLKLKRSALAKLFGISGKDFGVAIPNRRRRDIVRSRKAPDPKIEARNKDIVDFIKGTGLRREELLAVTARDIKDIGGHLLINVIKGKGGKFRYARVLPQYESYIKRLREKYISEGRENERLFEDIPKRLEAHHYRGDYAKALYSIIARDVKSIPPEERYCMRGDRKGEVLDKVAMYGVSRNLGHNRIDVIPGHYLY